MQWPLRVLKCPSLQPSFYLTFFHRVELALRNAISHTFKVFLTMGVFFFRPMCHNGSQSEPVMKALM